LEVTGDVNASGTQAGWDPDEVWAFGEETALLPLSRIGQRIVGGSVRRLKEAVIGLQGPQSDSSLKTTNLK